MSLDPSYAQTLDQTDDDAAASPGLLVVSPDGRVQFATARAALMARDLFVAASPSDRLPEAITRWLDDGTSGGQPSRFIVDRPGRRLCLQLLFRDADSICLLVEQDSGVSIGQDRHSTLTERQTEVLAWVARGKTNAEIAQILSLKTGTIGKYLERIFPKLGVENRTAAASFVLGTDRAN